MRSVLLAAICVTFSLNVAQAAVAIEVLEPDASVPAEAVEVKIAKMKFQTPELKVSPGSVVTWTNTEALPHNVHFKKNGNGVLEDIEGRMLRSNQSYSVRFNEPGSYDYICTPHPFMKGKVVVE